MLPIPARPSRSESGNLLDWSFRGRCFQELLTDAWVKLVGDVRVMWSSVGAAVGCAGHWSASRHCAVAGGVGRSVGVAGIVAYGVGSAGAIKAGVSVSPSVQVGVWCVLK